MTVQKTMGGSKCPAVATLIFVFGTMLAMWWGCAFSTTPFTSTSPTSTGTIIMVVPSNEVPLTHPPRNDNRNNNSTASPGAAGARCAINLFGLPRAFRQLVLPSMIHHVIPFNDCDYYVHYYYMTQEVAGRSGEGGVMDPNDIRLLEQAVCQHAPHGTDTAGRRHPRRTPIVEFAVDTEADFWRQYTPLVEKIRTTKVASTGRPLYFPYKALTYRQFTTTDNIIKMWHSIQSAWNLMERSEHSRHFNYTIVAMLRSDVVYVTKVQIDSSSAQNDSSATTVTIPAFGKHPVSDRAIYGNHDAVKIWATQRLSQLDAHVHWVQKNHPGWGMHSERFMDWTIFPHMRAMVREDPYWCFLRARADESVWIRDCEISAAPTIRKALGDVRTAVETAIGRPCSDNITQVNLRARALYCAASAATV
jgi:hypothetical protein